VTAQLLRGVTHADYHLDVIAATDTTQGIEDAIQAPPRLSRSLACTLLMGTPLEAYRQHPRLGGVGRPLVTKGADMGSIVHALMSGEGPAVEVCRIPAKDGKGKPRVASPAYVLDDALRETLLASHLIPAADWKTDDAQAFRDDARGRGVIPVLLHDYVTAKAAAAALPAKLAALGIDLATFEPELTILWEDEDGVALKTRPDLTSLPLGYFLDFKVKDKISEGAFEASIFKYGYDMQVAAAMEGLAAVHPEMAGRLDFDFVVCEWREPFDVLLKGLSPAFLDLGQQRWKRAKKLWKACLESGNWPGWGRRPPAEPRPWLLTQEFEHVLAQGDPDWAEGVGS
jgi:hypothetical protein